MIFDLIHDTFKRTGHTWNIGGSFVVPSSDDVQKVLDGLIGKVYDRPVDTQIEAGGLIVEKADSGYNVYVYVGNYE